MKNKSSAPKVYYHAENAFEMLAFFLVSGSGNMGMNGSFLKVFCFLRRWPHSLDFWLCLSSGVVTHLLTFERILLILRKSETEGNLLQS